MRPWDRSSAACCPGARKFVELGVRADKPIEELEPIEVAARLTDGAAARLPPPEEH